MASAGIAPNGRLSLQVVTHRAKNVLKRSSSTHDTHMVLVRVARLPDLQVPSDQVGSKMHHPVSEVLKPPPRAGSGGVSFSGLAVANDGMARCVGGRESFSHRLGLSKHGVPSLSPLSLHSSSGPASPIVKSHHAGAAHRLHACGTAHRLAAQRRGGSGDSGGSGGSAAAVGGGGGGGSRPPLQPCHVQQQQPPRAAGASRSLHASPSRKRVAHPPPPRLRYGCSLQSRSRALHVPPPRRARVPCA